jgi:hypothetical protein
MIKFMIIAVIIGLSPSIGLASEVVAKTRTWAWTFTVTSEGDPWDKSCKLKLVADTYQLKREINLKKKDVNCALFGPVNMYAAEAPDRESTMLFFEASRGGDGDHSGPIVEAYRLTRAGFKKLGEQELFDATYHRKDEQITSVTGTVLYSFCESCDGPDATDPADNFYVPAKITIGSTGFSIKPMLSKTDRKSLLEKFDSRSAAVMKENDFDKDSIQDVRKALNTFLNK